MGFQMKYIGICTGIQHNGFIITVIVNFAKLSDKKPARYSADMRWRIHLRSQSGSMLSCTPVNSLYSFTKEPYNHYGEVTTKYINRYNALFSIALRCADNLKDMLFLSLCTAEQNCYWHSIRTCPHLPIVKKLS